MKRCVLLPFLVLLWLLPQAPPLHADVSISYLIASPAEGHPGDTFYLSGVNLTPKAQLYVYMTCPIWSDPNVYKYGNAGWLAQPPSDSQPLLIAPHTDGNGDFSGLKVQAIKLNHLSGSICYIYETIGGTGLKGVGTGFGPDIPATYYIHVSGKLNRCDISICGTTLRSTPDRSTHGSYENISVHQSAWPGAHVSLNVSIQGMSTRHVHGVLDVHGNLRLRVRMPTGAGSHTTAHVWATLSLGRFKGSTKPTAFAVR